MVPTLLNFLVAHPSCNSGTMGHIHTAVAGAAPVSPSSAYALKEKLKNNVVFLEGLVFMQFI